MKMKLGKDQWKAYLAVCVSAILFGCSYSLGDIVEASSMSKTCNSFWTSVFAICLNLLLGVFTKKSPFRQKISKNQILLCMLCGVSATWLSNYLFLVAYSQGVGVAEATMLHFLHPAMIAVVMSVLFHERFSLAKLAAIICSLVAVVLITGGGAITGSTAGILAALATGVAYGLYPLLLDVTSLHEVEGRTILIYMHIACAACAAAVSLLNGSFMAPVSPTVWGCDLLLSGLSFFAYLLSTYAIGIIGATNTSFAAMLEPVASCVIAAVVLGQAIGLNVLYSGIMVLLSVFFCAMNNRNVEKEQNLQKVYNTR
ncbi:MAG: DMT family transporter [Firmicutes bacterium]|nr:DMT family transporter [Bacillota bacterium]